MTHIVEDHQYVGYIQEALQRMNACDVMGCSVYVVGLAEDNLYYCVWEICYTIGCICCSCLGFARNGLAVMRGAGAMAAADNHSQGNKGEHGHAGQGTNNGE